MTIRSEFAKVLQHEDINFLLTNRIPRRFATRFLGWFSRIENPLVARASIALLLVIVGGAGLALWWGTR